jgi:hypothetical protein
VSVDDVAKDGSTKDRLNAYFNTAAFDPPPVIGTGCGNATRNFLRGLGQANVDVALSKSAAIGVSHRIEFRVEAFNVFNTPNFGNPGTNAANAASFGMISTTVGSPRVSSFAKVLTVSPTRSCRDRSFEHGRWRATAEPIPPMRPRMVVELQKALERRLE